MDEDTYTKPNKFIYWRKVSILLWFGSKMLKIIETKRRMEKEASYQATSLNQNFFCMMPIKCHRKKLHVITVDMINFLFLYVYESSVNPK